MAAFDVIYRIATDLSGLQKGVDQTAKSTQAIDQKMEGLKGTVAATGKALVGLFAAQQIGSAILSLSKQVIAFGSTLTDISAKTGISLEGLQYLKIAAEQNGVSLDQVATAANKLGVNLAGGGKDLKHALDALGLSFDKMKTQTPEQNLYDVAKAFDTIENPADRAKLAMVLFGKSGIELLPILNGQFSAAAAAARRLGLAIGDDFFAASDKFDDQMIVVKASLMKVVAEGLAPLLPALIGGANLFTRMASGAMTFGRAIVDHVIGAILKAKEVFYGFATIAADIALSVPGMSKLLGVTQVDAFAKLKAKTQEAADAYKIFTQKTADAASGTGKYEAATRKALPAISDWGSAHEDAAKATAKAAAERKQLADQLSGYEVDAYKANSAGFEKEWDKITAASKRTGDAIIANFEAVQKAMGKLPAPTKTFIEALEDAGVAALKVNDSVRELAGSLGKGLLGVLKTVPQTLVAAFTGGGGLLGAVKGIGTQLGSVLGEHIGKGISAATKGLGALAGPIGAAVGALAGPLIGLLSGKLNQGGGTPAQKAAAALEAQVRTLRFALLETAGGFQALQGKAAAAGVTLAAVLNAKTPEAYQKAIEDLNAAFEFQDQALKTLDDTAAKWGFTLAEAPAKFRQGKLDEQFLELYKDQQVLTAGGFDFDAILRKQAGSFTELIKVALATGASIPIHLKPAVDRLIEMGLITDDNGEALEGLGTLTFAETLDGKFQTLIKSIGDLVAAIERGLNPALINIPHPAAPWAEWPAPPGVPDYSGVHGWAGGDEASHGWRGGVMTAGRGLLYLAAGGPVGPFISRGADVYPAMLSAGEGVLSTTGMQALGELNHGGRPGGSGIDLRPNFTAIENKIDSLTRALSMTIPTQTANAVRHAVQTAGGRRR